MTVPRIVVVLAMLAVLALGAPGTAAAQSNPCAPPVTNEIACENTLPGTPESVWGIDGTSGDETLQGYATAMSVNRGEPVSFKIDTTAPGYTIDIYRIGYYGGAGARRIVTGLSHAAPQDQPAVRRSPPTPG